MLPSALQAAARLKQAQQAHALMMFQPSPALAHFCSNFDDRYICVRAANRVGKTRHAVYKAAKWAASVPGLRCRVGGPSRRQVQDVVGRYLADFLEPTHTHPSSYYTPGRGWNQPTIRLKNGSQVQLRSFEDHPTSWAGDELDLVILDEPPPAHIFMESMARTMSRQGVVNICLTPVGRPVQWLRELIEAPGSPWVEYVAEFSHENCPWYSAEQVAGWLDVLESSPWEKQQRAYGAWDGITAERYYTGLSEANIDAQAIPAGTDVQLALCIDHGEVGSNTVALLLLWGGGTARPSTWQPQAGRHVWVIDEHVSTDGDSEVQHAAGILAMLQRQGFRAQDVKIAVGDTNRRGNWRINDLLSSEVARQLKRKTPPFRLQNATKHRDWGHRVLNGALKRQELYVHPRCKAVIKTLRHWKGGKTGEDGQLSHAADALRYGVLSILQDRPYYAGLRF